MDIGIGLPNAVRVVDRSGIVDWARRAEEAGFASLGTLDRIVYPNYESLIALAAAAAVTERIRLVTDILIVPLRASTALLAKQAATIDHLSGGRLVLGLSPGGREDDYTVSGLDFHARGRTFDRQLEELPRLWRGEGGVGPAPASGERPALLIGGSSARALRRASTRSSASRRPPTRRRSSCWPTPAAERRVGARPDVRVEPGVERRARGPGVARVRERAVAGDALGAGVEAAAAEQRLAPQQVDPGVVARVAARRGLQRLAERLHARGVRVLDRRLERRAGGVVGDRLAHAGQLVGGEHVVAAAREQPPGRELRVEGSAAVRAVGDH